MKIIRKTISALLLAGVGITSIQAQNNSSQAWTLRQCIDYAIEHNIEIRQSANNVEAGKVSVNTTKWARLPNLSGSASQNWSWGRTASPIDNSYSDINSANTSFSLGTNIPIFTGLQLSNQYSLAKLDLKAAIEDLNKAREDIAINVTSAYLQVLFNQELSKIAHNQVDLSKDQLKRIQGLQGVGKASSSEVAEAQARVAQDEMTAVQSDNTYKLSLLDLTQLLELPTPEGFVLESPKEELSSNLSLRRMTYIHRRLLTNQALRLQNIVYKVVLIVFVLPKVRFIHNSLSVPVWEVIIIRLAEDQRAASAVR